MENQSILVCTHDGMMHSDEILAVALLRLAGDETHVAVMRSRNERDFERADYVVDVGGKYDGQKWFDHHQPGFDEKYPNGVLLSSFGLVWRAVGITAVRSILRASLEAKIVQDTDIVEVVKDMERFVLGVDMHDQAKLQVLARHSLDRGVSAEVGTVQTIISGFNPVPLLEDNEPRFVVEQFYAALAFAENYLRRLVLRKASEIIAEPFVRAQVKPNEPILILPAYCDWHNLVFNEYPHILFVIFPSGNGRGYTVQAVKKGRGPNTVDNLKVPFPASWAGLTTEELAAKSGVNQVWFCHRERFIASAATLEAAKALAQKSLEQQ